MSTENLSNNAKISDNIRHYEGRITVAVFLFRSFTEIDLGINIQGVSQRC